MTDSPHYQENGRLDLFVSPVDDTVYSAVISPCGLYRYRLSRCWGPGRRMVWVMLNPSTADAEVDDPTIRRCMGFAKREGYGAIDVINLYALRATKPIHLSHHPDPEGPGNLHYWDEVLDDRNVGMVVAAWGAHFADPFLPISQAFVHAPTAGWQCLGHTKNDHPRHPLYVRADQPFEHLEWDES